MINNFGVSEKFSCDKKILASRLVMGSNFKADVKLKKALELLSDLSFVQEIILINSHISQDYKKLTDKLYHNQGILIQFNGEVLFEQFKNELKSIEKLCGRMHNDSNLVVLDIDIIQIYFDENWWYIFERYPLKEHELICLNLK